MSIAQTLKSHRGSGVPNAQRAPKSVAPPSRNTARGSGQLTCAPPNRPLLFQLLYRLVGISASTRPSQNPPATQTRRRGASLKSKQRKRRPGDSQTTAANIRKTASEKFDFAHLRPGQLEGIEAILAGQDALVVMPTGSGKSAIYQIAGVLMDGPVIVVSPLIALQRDQMQSIDEAGAADAAVVNSTVGVRKTRETFDQLESGDLKFVFLAPEQFDKPETLDQLRDAHPSLFVIDEAHCISEWGHDFRPDYLRLGAVNESLGRLPVLALTATAGPEVRDEIADRLQMRDARVIVQGFNRPNIWLGVKTFPSEREKTEALLQQVQEAEKPGIVYVATRKHAEEIAAALDERGVDCSFYHGGMRAKERDEIQDAFMNDRVPIMVATSAFGMGVDKPNVRFVFHYDVSESIDAYYQEIGRGGRDGKPARAVLFYRPEDLSLQRFFAGAGKLRKDQVEQVASAIEGNDEPLDLEEVKERTGLSEAKVTKAVNRLEEVGALEIHPDGDVSATPAAEEVEKVAEQATKEQEKRHDFEMLRLEKMRLYAELLDCRREYLLNYFGEKTEKRCGHCDSCESQAQADRPPSPENASTAMPNKENTRKKRTRVVDEEDQPFPPKTRVEHKEWGRGVVEDYDGDKVEIVFDSVGAKILSVRTVVEHDLLSRL
jgi:ATP-dependent DNA helicase RecQ